MASAHSVQNGDCNDDRFSEMLPCADYAKVGEPKLLPPILADFSVASDEFGEPDIHPRIGDAYQVDISPLIKDTTNISCSRNCIDKLDSRTRRINISEFSHGDKSENCYEDRTQNLFISADKFAHDLHKPLGESEENLHECRGEGYHLVPRLDGESWTGDEKASFLLGLYIFKKNFVEVRRFVETKDMGSVLSFYYGRFYGSRDYIRWSECRKTKSKKCAYGHRIFSGSRQQKFLSRLIPNVSEECQNALLEVSKSFADEKMSLVDYVSSLKAMVGMNILDLVKALGIGTGKQDLTGMALEPCKSNKAIPMCIEIPTRKACSSLTTAEIIKFLSGDCRLSKARSNDLFWEAVWPRLLARGWHSEQPTNQGYVAGYKHGLVFLVPGVQTFSRRKLVKGDQYFDSITDVLSKVAKEPGIIELEIQESESEKNEDEYKRTSAKNLTQDEGGNQPTREQHFYLKPRIRNRKAGAMKFTVVDTSLCGGIVRELSSFPSEISNLPGSQYLTGDIDEDFEAPIAKRRSRLPVLRSSTGPGLEKGMCSPRADAHESTKSTTSRVESCQEKLPPDVSSKGSRRDDVEFPRPLIDLNVPQVIQDFENDVSSTEACEKRENQTPIPCRRSTRNRPPTSRALEAIANGYLTVNRRRKGKDVSSHEDSEFRPAQRARVVAHLDVFSDNTRVAPKVQETETGPSNHNISYDSVQ